MSVELSLQNPQRYPEAGVRRLKPWLEWLVTELAPDYASLGVRFTGDREMEGINRKYRDREGTTDVLSFPGGESPEGRHLGDLVISVPAARRQAEAAGHGVERELEVLLLHGLLHCLGYDHEGDDGTMERLERRLRRRFVDGERRGDG